MKLRMRFSSFAVNRLLTGLVLALLLAIALAVWQLPVPHLAINYDETTIDVRADGAWSLWPGDCLQIRWTFDGELPVHVDGKEWHESGEQQFCPTILKPSPLIEMTDHRRGAYFSQSLNVYYLPEFLLNLMAVSTLAFFPLIALYYLWNNDLQSRPAFRAIVLATLAVVLGIVFFRVSGRALTIVGVLAILRNLFLDHRWLYFGIILTAILYVALAIQALWLGYKNRRVADFVVIVGLLLFIVLLYLPFGFATIAQWEEWFGRAFFEGIYRRRLYTELTQRYWWLLPYGMGYLLSSETFSAYNMIYALFLWGKLAVFYGILRYLGVWQLCAFLATMFFAVYPVDDGLMSLRSLHIQFSILTLLTAIYLVLRYLRNPTRSHLAGVWLALAISVGTYEAQYALILVLPLLWWHRICKPRLREINMTIIWYLVPALKMAYMVLLVVTGRGFYRSNYVYAGTEVRVDSLIPTTIKSLLEVYGRTFVLGWGDALADLGRNSWLPLTLVMLALVGSVSWYLWRREYDKRNANERHLIFSFMTGMLLIIPAVGVLIWFGYYSQDLWRLYLYVPGPAAIALFSLIALIASRLPSDRFQNAAIVIACLLLMFPAISRLILQHEHFVVSANNKRRVLQQIVQIAPVMESQTRVLVLSDMPAEIRLSKHIEEMKSNMIGSALYVIYGAETSGLGSMCLSAENCSPIMTWADHLSDTLVFLLDEDLSLELVTEPETIFSAFKDLNYDVNRLYNSDAPLPSRAYTMLGLTGS